MNKFDSLDSFSYQCGVIDAFNEVVKAGVKRIALSHPTDTLAECQALIPFSEQICRQYGKGIRKGLLRQQYPSPAFCPSGQYQCALVPQASQRLCKDHRSTCRMRLFRCHRPCRQSLQISEIPGGRRCEEYSKARRYGNDPAFGCRKDRTYS